MNLLRLATVPDQSCVSNSDVWVRREEENVRGNRDSRGNAVVCDASSEYAHSPPTLPRRSKPVTVKPSSRSCFNMESPQGPANHIQSVSWELFSRHLKVGRWEPYQRQRRLRFLLTLRVTQRTCLYCFNFVYLFDQPGESVQQSRRARRRLERGAGQLLTLSADFQRAAAQHLSVYVVEWMLRAVSADMHSVEVPQRGSSGLPLLPTPSSPCNLPEGLGGTGNTKCPNG